MKKKVLVPAVLLVFLSIVTGAVMLPWGGSLLKKGILDGVQSLGSVSGDIGTVKGNPVKGYDITDVSLADSESETVLTASKAGFSLDLKALLSGKICLERIYVEGAKVDENRLVSLIQGMPASTSTIEVEIGEIFLSDISSVTDEWNLVSGIVSQDQGIWSGAISAQLRGAPIEGNVKVAVKDEGISILSSSFLVMGGEGSLSGDISPSLGLSGNLKGLSLESIGAMSPSSVKVHGTLGLDFALSGTADDPRGSGSIVLENGGLSRFEIPGLKGDWSYNDSKLVLSSWRGSASGTSISGDMTLFMGDSPSISAVLEAADLDLRSWFGDDPRIKDLSGGIGGIHLEVKGPFDGLTAKIWLEDGDILYSGLRLSSIKGKGEMKESGGFLLDLSSSLLGGTASVNGKVNIGKNLLDLSVALRSIELADTLSIAGSDGQDIKGALTADLKVTGSPDEPVVSGSLQSSSIKAYAVSLEDSQVSFQYGKGVIAFPSVVTGVGKSRISGKGTVKLQDPMEIAFDGNLSGVTGEGLSRSFPDIAGLGLAGAVNGSWSYSSKGAGFGTVNLSLSSPSFSLAEAFPLKNLTAQLAINGDRVEIKNSSAGLYGGSLSLAGTVSVGGSGGMDFKGNLSSVDGTQLMKAIGMEGKGQIDGSFKVSGSPSSPILDLSIGSKKLELAGLELDGLDFSLKTVKDQLVASLKGALSGVPLSGGGWIKLPSGKNKGALDLEASVEGLDIKSLLPKGVEIGGTMSTKLHLLGPLGKTKLYVKGSAPRLQVGNTSFASVDLGGYVGQGDVISFEGSSQFGDKRVNVSCDLKPSDKGWSLGFVASGNDVNLYSLASGLEGVVDGRVHMAMKGSWTDGYLSASGKISSKELSASGIKIKSVSLPVSIKGTDLAIKGGKAGLYGGPVTLDLEVDLTKSTWKGRAEAKSADLKPLVKDVVSLPGVVSGTIDLRLDMSGVAGRAFLMDITGFVKGRSLEMSDFDVLQAVTKGKPFKIRDLWANFNLDGQELYILPGSRASAWPGDEVYRYIEASGSIRPSSSEGEDPLELTCGGEINLNAFNALLGAMKNILKASIDSLKDPRSLATDLLSGLIGGYSSQEFRDISLNVGGSFESPVISKLKISDKQGFGIGGDGLPSSPGEPKIRIKIDIPTGEGGGQEVDAGDQVKEQLMEGLLKQVVGGSN